MSCSSPRITNLQVPRLCGVFLEEYTSTSVVWTIYGYAYARRSSLRGCTTYTPHKDVSRTKTSQPTSKNELSIATVHHPRNVYKIASRNPNNLGTVQAEQRAKRACLWTLESLSHRVYVSQSACHVLCVSIPPEIEKDRKCTKFYRNWLPRHNIFLVSM